MGGGGAQKSKKQKNANQSKSAAKQDQKPPSRQPRCLRLTSLSRDGSKVWHSSPTTDGYQEDPRFFSHGNQASQVSHDGSLFAFTDSQRSRVTVVAMPSSNIADATAPGNNDVTDDAPTTATATTTATTTTESAVADGPSPGDIICTIEEPFVSGIHFSPKNSFIFTWRRPFTQKEIESHGGVDPGNVAIWDLSTGKQKLRFTQQNRECVQWNSSEDLCVRMVQDELICMHGKTFAVTKKLAIENVASFALSNVKTPSLAVFVPESKGAPASMRVYRFPFGETPIVTKSYFKADGVDFHWNSKGSALLVLTHTEVDKTGKSYYGETNLYFVSADGSFDCRINLPKDGPIHDVQWNPKGTQFVVVYGYTPAAATLFDIKTDVVFQFGERPRNTARWNPQGRFLMLGGFGNLNGDMIFWDVQTRKTLGSANAHSAAFYEWSPDGRYFTTAILFQRLKVDNGFKVWKYNGMLKHHQRFEELYQVAWQPLKEEETPNDCPPSPRGLKEPFEAASASATGGARPATATSAVGGARYIPPALRNSASAGDSSARSTHVQSDNRYDNNPVVFKYFAPPEKNDRRPVGAPPAPAKSEHRPVGAPPPKPKQGKQKKQK